MTDFVVTDFVGDIEDDLETAVAALETYLETVVNTATIIIADVKCIGPGKYFQAYALWHAATS